MSEHGIPEHDLLDDESSVVHDQQDLDAPDAGSDCECEVTQTTKKRRKPKAKFQRLSKARQLANARERRRAQRIHDGFTNLARHVPQEPSEENRLSRMEILQRAIDYITYLEGLLGLERDGHPPPSLAETPTTSGSDSRHAAAAALNPGSSSCKSPVAVSTVNVQTPTANSLTGIDCARVHPTVSTTTFGGSLTLSAEGKVPLDEEDLNLATIDFDVDEDLSDIPASPEDLYNDLESIISSGNEQSSCTDARDLDSGSYMPTCGTASLYLSSGNHAFSLPLVRQSSGNQVHYAYGQLQAPPSYETVSASHRALPRYSAVTSTHQAGLVTNGADTSVKSAQIVNTSAFSALPSCNAFLLPPARQSSGNQVHQLQVSPYYEAISTSHGAPYTNLAQTSTHEAGLVTNGAETSVLSAQILNTSAFSSTALPSGTKRQHDGTISHRPETKRARMATSKVISDTTRISPSYATCNLAVEYQTLQTNSCSV
ncbi:uncharacterized protein LOC134195789 [Corticium candelabrum]|uniref:uncharacterized protein LOC134195789 n=1 Tax=Corticium candelabrum TaxID=121492 RepID=UPI002E26D768|nr:uncharacterized protein LOC134195789 [Corticium candelabrum]